MNIAKIACHIYFLLSLSITLPFICQSARAENDVASSYRQNADATNDRLKDIDREIDRLDQLHDNAPTKEEKTAAKARIDLLKERRKDLRANYVQNRYDELKADIKTEYNKMSKWTAKTLGNDRDMTGAPAGADARVVAAHEDIDAYKLNPSDQNKAEVKAMLDSLDADIDRLANRIDQMPAGSERDAAKDRLQTLKAGRKELASDFRKARYETIKADLKDEWDKVTR